MFCANMHISFFLFYVPEKLLMAIGGAQDTVKFSSGTFTTDDKAQVCKKNW